MKNTANVETFVNSWVAQNVRNIPGMANHQFRRVDAPELMPSPPRGSDLRRARRPAVQL